MSDGPGAEVRGAPEKVTPEQMQRLGTLGRGMLQEAAQKPGAKESSPALKMVDALRTGIDPRTGGPLEDAGLTGGHLLMTPKEFKVDVDGTPTTDRLCVAGIVKKNPNGTYECTFAPVGPDGTVGEVLSVKGNISPEDLIDMQAAAEASELSGLFTGDAKEAFDTYTTSRHEGSEFMAPSKTDTLLGKVATDFGIPLDQTPQTEREIYTPEQQRVADETRRLEGRADKLSDQEQKLLANLKLALKMQSGEAGDLFIYNALQQIQDALPKEWARTGKVTVGREVAEGDQAEWQRLQDLMDNLKDSATEQQKMLFDLLGSETSKKQLEKWQALAQESGGINKVFTDPEFQSLLTESKGEEVCKFLFGKDMTGMELKGLLSDMQLSPELKKELESGNKLGILKIILLIAAGLIAAPIVVTGAAAFAVGGAASRSQQ